MKHFSKCIKRAFSILISLSVLLTGLIIPTNAQALDSQPIIYDFHLLGVDDGRGYLEGQGTQEGWSIIYEETDYAITQNVYGIHVENDTRPGKVTLSFYVPQDGNYEVKFSSCQAGGGGLADIYIDGIKVGEHDFYSAAPKDTVLLRLNVVNLTAGTHKLVLDAQRRTEGSWGYEMYPTQFVLVPTTEAPTVQPTSIVYDFHKLGVDDGRGNLEGQGTQEGWSIVYEETDYAVSQNVYGLHVENDTRPGKITLSFTVPEAGYYEVRFKSCQAGGGGLADIYIDGVKIGEHDFYSAVPKDTDLLRIKVVELTAGVHKLVLDAQRRTDGSWGYEMYPSEFVLVPTDEIPSDMLELTYDFHLLGVDDGLGKMPGQGTQEGWSIVYEETDHAVSQNVYGLHVENDGYKGKATFLFYVPIDGFYEAKFKSCVAGGGGIADISIDGRNIASHDFYSANPTNTPLLSLKTVALTAGWHKLVLDAQRRSTGSWGYEMYPSMFMLVQKESLPTVVSMDPGLERNSLLVGQSMQLHVSALLSDGNTDTFEYGTKEYSSADSSIASVNASGLITANKLGNTTINTKVTSDDGQVYNCPVNISVVKLGLEKVQLNRNLIDMLIGRTKTLTVTGTLNDNTSADLSKEGTIITYASSNPGIVSIDQNGVMTGLAKGTATVTVQVEQDGAVKTDSATVNVLSPEEAKSVKTRATIYTPEKIAAVRQNIEKYDWAENEKNKAVLNADKYLALGDDAIWEMVTPQSLPRAVDVNLIGCPNCGMAIYSKGGSFPWRMDFFNDPWKLECPNCKLKFPTNDFESYYKSGLDENNIFNPALADRSLLVNTECPEKGEKWGVDDGFGYIDQSGNRYAFIAYYIHWGLWHPSMDGALIVALNSFRDAYIYTGDLKYAHAGIILLDRIADIYPSMDLTPYTTANNGFHNSHGGMDGKGKVMGNIQEPYIARDFSKAYDAFFPALTEDDPANVIPFLSEKSTTYDLINPKTTATHIKQNMEDGIIRQVYPGVKNAQIYGNAGWHQSALATAAVVLDTMPETKEWIDFVMKSGGQSYDENGWVITGGEINELFTCDVDKDGMGNEGSPDYDLTWLTNMMMLADVLKGYDKYPTADLYQNVKFKKMFELGYDLMMSGKYTPSIGDSGVVGAPGIRAYLNQVVKAVENWHDPDMARFAYYLNGNKIDGIHGDIFSTDPEGIADEIQQVIDTQGILDHTESTDLTGFGFAALRDGKSYLQKYGTQYDFINMEVKDANVSTTPYTNSGTLQVEANEPDKYISFDFNVPETNNYELDLKVFKANSYGKYDILIDDVKLTEFDFYGAGGVKDPEMIGNLELTAGLHEIKFVNTGRNTDSSNYKMGLIRLILLNESDKVIRDQILNMGDTQRDFWMYYGRNMNHGHSDTLNLGVHAFGLDLAPDLGYPTWADEMKERMEWTRNTISHNTVVVDKKRQIDQWVAVPHNFDDTDTVKIMDVEAPNVYPINEDRPNAAGQTELYRRTVAMIKIDDKNSYAIDIFRVKGGNDHYYSFHSADGTVATEGLNLVQQTSGTYAGVNVEFGKRPQNDGVPGWGYDGSGFHWLSNVQKDETPSSNFSVDWKVKDTWNALSTPQDIHLKLTMLNDNNDVAICEGQPPQNQAGTPKSLKYLVAHRQGENLSSQFLSVIEPYKNESSIQSIEKAAITVDGTVVDNEDVAAVKVTLKNGRIDYIVNSLNTDITYTIDGKFQFKGFYGVYSEVNGIQTYGYVCGGTQTGYVKNETGSVSGTVADFTRDMNMENEITVDLNTQNVNVNDLVGRYIYIENDNIRNGSYKILGIKKQEGSRVTLDIGDITLIRSYVDPDDFTKGYVYDIAAGAGFIVPLSVEMDVYLAEAALSSDKTELTREQSAALALSGKLNTGDAFDLTNATVEYFSSNPDIVSVENGTATAHNPGEASIYANVTLNGVTVKSSSITINVTVSIESMQNVIDIYKQSGDLKGPLLPQLQNSLDQAQHQLEKDSVDIAVKHMQDFLKHLGNTALENNVSEKAKAALETDINVLISFWTEK